MAVSDKDAALFDKFKKEETDKPLTYVPHDTDAMLDDDMRFLVIEQGIAMYGVWWVLVELLARRKGHRYDVTDDIGWKFLASDMSGIGETFSVDQVKAFVDVFEEHGLVHRDVEHGRTFLSNDRIIRTALASAEKTAKRRLGAAKTNG